MSDVATAHLEEQYEQAEALDPDEAPDYAEARLVDATLPSRLAIAATGRQAEFTRGLRAQADYVAHLHDYGERYLEQDPCVQPRSLLWRFAAAVATSSGIVAVGLTLLVIAATGRPVEPNPYIALAVLLVGLALCGTMFTIINGDRPRLRWRRF